MRAYSFHLWAFKSQYLYSTIFIVASGAGRLNGGGDNEQKERDDHGYLCHRPFMDWRCVFKIKRKGES